jgi:hexokinase
MELIDEGAMFLGQNTYKLESVYSLDTAFLSLMESWVSTSSVDMIEKTNEDSHRDPTDELLTIVGIFSHFYALETTLEERQFFRALARLIGRRAARLAACGIAAIVRKKGYLEEGCEVGADGTLYNVCCCWSYFGSSIDAPIPQKYPGFKQRIHQGLIDVLGEKGK